MKKFYSLVFFLYTFAAVSFSQKSDYKLTFRYVDGNTILPVKLKSSFRNVKEAAEYLSIIPQELLVQGYPAASVDSISFSDSSAVAYIYSGPGAGSVKFKTTSESFRWLQIKPTLLNGDSFLIAPSPEWYRQRNRMLDDFDNTGYLFAKTELTDPFIKNDTLSGILTIDRGFQYPFDSISIVGGLKLQKQFLYNYLGLNPGEPFNKSRLNNIDQKLQELPYLNIAHPSEVVYLGSGAYLNLYAEPRKTSQVDFLVGLSPSVDINNNKPSLIYDVNLNLKNAFQAGESIILKANQLMPKSPKINLGYAHPFVFKSRFGLSGLFELFKRDSNFLQITARGAADYTYNEKQNASLFFQLYTTTLLQGALDTNSIKASKRLPASIDASVYESGLEYRFNNTNFRLNPIKGYDLYLSATAGIKNLKPNEQVLKLKDTSFNYASLYDNIKRKTYQVRLRADVARYFKITNASTVKTVLKTGLLFSENIFLNDLFHVSNYNIIRGYDDASLFADKFLAATVEYRKLIDLRSYLFGFVESGFIQSNYQAGNASARLLSGGLGITYEAKAGLLNLSVALGSRSDIPFKMRNAAKIHIGYINYF